MSLGGVYRPWYIDKRTGERKQQKVWWSRIYVNGKEIRRSTRCRSKKEAERVHARWLHERGLGVRRHDVEKTTFEQGEELIRGDYAKKGLRSVRRLDTSLKHLGDAFGDWRLVQITTAAWSGYQADRLREGAAPASINRERSALLRMLNLARDHDLVLEVPKLDRLREDNVREVELSPEEFAGLLQHLPARVQPVAIFGYITGWRMREILTRTWADVDWDDGWVWLDRETAKNRQPKAFPLGAVDWLDDTLREQEVRKRQIEKRTGRIVTHVFFILKGPRAGEPFQGFRRSWATACEAAGFADLNFHDLRRSAAVQLLEAGVPETHAMRIMGHETRSIFERYAISKRKALRAAGEKLGAHYGSRPTPDRKVVNIEHRR